MTDRRLLKKVVTEERKGKAVAARPRAEADTVCMHMEE